MKRYLCRHVIVDDVDMGLCLVHITRDLDVEIIPFERETPSTVYLDGLLVVNTHHGKLSALIHNGKPLPV